MTHYRPLRFVDGYRRDDQCSLVGVGKGRFSGVVVLGAEGKEKNAGLKAVTLIATLNPVSQVLW